MSAHLGLVNDCRRRLTWPSRVPLGLYIGVLLAFSVNEACAAALGSLATSVGLFAALAALFVIKGWPAHMPATALSSACGALAMVGGAAWVWRARIAARSLGITALRGVGRDQPERTLDRPMQVAHVTLPAGLDRDTLLAELRLIFMRLQEAWDLGALPALQALTTTEMLSELCLGLSACNGGASGRTDVVTLRAELFGFEEVSGAIVASVEFSGLMREAPGECAAPFRELWMLTRSKQDSSDWKLARHQALL